MISQKMPPFLRLLLAALMLVSGFMSCGWAQDESADSNQEQETPAQSSQDTERPEAEQDDESELPKIRIGVKAPSLDIEYWISDDDGFYLHTEEFEDDTIYVIDFWGLQWRPTILTLPQMAEIQKKFKDDNVQVISIGQNKLDQVEKFLDRKLSNVKEGPNTFRKITESFCLTCDPDNSVFKDYFIAARRTQLPTSFIVGKDGKIEWIGHRLNMQDVLQQLVDDKWDRDAFAKTYDEGLRKEGLMLKFGSAMPREADDEARLKYIEEKIGESEFELIKYELSMLRVRLLIRMKDKKAGDTLRKFADDFTKDEDSAIELNNMIWEYYELYEKGEDVDDELLKACLYAAKVAIKFAPKSGAVNDTVAHFVYVVEEDLDQAIEWQRKAVANAEGREADLQPFLDKLLKEKKEGKSDSKKSKSDKKKTDF